MISKVLPVDDQPVFRKNSAPEDLIEGIRPVHRAP
jgi:hypothetical protein